MRSYHWFRSNRSGCRLRREINKRRWNEEKNEKKKKNIQERNEIKTKHRPCDIRWQVVSPEASRQIRCLSTLLNIVNYILETSLYFYLYSFQYIFFFFPLLCRFVLSGAHNLLCFCLRFISLYSVLD